MPEIKFLLMDEKYADPKLPALARITALTGLLIPGQIHGEVRARFYELVAKTLATDKDKISALPIIHASSIFPDLKNGDETRFDFVRGIVDIITSCKIRIYRIAYLKTQKMGAFHSEQQTIGLCFSGLIYLLEPELSENQIWPVMETDHSAAQDRSFAGFIRNVDYLTSRLGSLSMSIDNKNLGEVLYSTKHSAHGALVDFVAYLRHIRNLKQADVELTPFKERLHTIAEPLDGASAFDEVIELKFEPPPKGYKATGPIRYAAPITPTD